MEDAEFGYEEKIIPGTEDLYLKSAEDIAKKISEIITTEERIVKLVIEVEKPITITLVKL